MKLALKAALQAIRQNYRDAIIGETPQSWVCHNYKEQRNQQHTGNKIKSLWAGNRGKSRETNTGLDARQERFRTELM